MRWRKENTNKCLFLTGALLAIALQPVRLTASPQISNLAESSVTAGQGGKLPLTSPVLVARALGATTFSTHNAWGQASQADGSSKTPDPPPADATKSPKIDNADYKIGEQDVLMIVVWKEPQLSGQVIVRPDGKISLPLVNEVRAAGLTPTELQTTLQTALRPFVAIPQVSVSVREINSQKVYVIGQVSHEGTVRVTSSMTVLQAIVEAGGLRDYANRKKIYVMRNVQGKQVRYPFNYGAVIRGRHYEQNIVLQPGDTIVVP